MEDKKKPKVGQVLYSLNTGGTVNRYKPQGLTKVIVKKVGRKYFACGVEGCRESQDVKYVLSNWRESTPHMPWTRLYTTEKEWNDERDGEKFFSEIKEFFSGYTNRGEIPLDTLRRIKEIIDETVQK